MWFVLNTNLFADLNPNIYIPELALFLTLNFEFQLFRNFFEHQTFFLDALGIRIFDMTLITSSTV